MAVWLVHGSSTVGIEDGIIRAGDYAELVSATLAAAALHAERERLLAAARDEAAALVEQARRHAEELTLQAAQRMDEAHLAAEGARRSGFEQGLAEAATHWMAQALSAADVKRLSLSRESERLASIVTMAVERVVDQQDRVGLFRQALRSVSKLLAEASMVTLRVSEAEAEHARGAVQSLQQHSGVTMVIEVVSDAAMPNGTCRFESDHGVVDAGLETQLTAIRRAVTRAAHEMAQELHAEEGGAAARQAVEATAADLPADVGRGDESSPGHELNEDIDDEDDEDDGFMDDDDYDDYDESDDMDDLEDLEGFEDVEETLKPRHSDSATQLG